VRTLAFIVSLVIALASARVASARDIRPHFDKPWRERVAEAQAAYRTNPETSAGRVWAAPPEGAISANERWEVEGLLLAWECENAADDPDTWDHMWLEIIDAAWDDADLYIYIITRFGSDAADIARCQQLLENYTDRDAADAVWFSEEDRNHDSIWIRDYGPLFILDADDKVRVVDANYVRYSRDNDDAQPAHFATSVGMALHQWDFATEGGNFLASGNGICIVSETIFGLNPSLDKSQIEQQYQAYLGCTELVVLPALDDVTGHVDMWILWVDDTTLVVGEYTQEQDASSRATIETAIENQLTGLVDPGSGNTIEVLRFPMPNNSGGNTWRTYTNGIWIGDTFLMPVYDGYQALQAQATATLEARGITVVPIGADHIISSAGALHCISKTIPAGAARPIGGRTPRYDIDPIGAPAISSDTNPPGDTDRDNDPGGADAGCAAGSARTGRESSGPLALVLLGAMLLVGRRRRRVARDHTR